MHIKHICWFLLPLFLLTGCQKDAFFASDIADGDSTLARPVAQMEPSPAPGTEAAVSPALAPPEKEQIVLSFVGDIMLASENGDDGFWTFNLFAYDTPSSYYLEKMLPIFAEDDFTIANGENVFTDRELPKREKEENPGYWYCSGTENAAAYRDGSVEYVSLANNHALDYGIEGRRDTAAALEAVGVHPVTEMESVVLEKAGVRIGLLCASMYSEYYCTQIIEWLAEAEKSTDFQIVFYHGGTERIHEPEDWKIRASRSLIDAGADLVIGSHPHVLQRREVYQGKEILYSLGNFLFGGSHTCENRTIVYQMTLDITDGVITGQSSEMIPCYCYGELWQPAPITDEEEKARVLAFMEGTRDLPY